jgi:protein gp37
VGQNTQIEWVDHTFNPWIGCTKVSPACDHCYAEKIARRLFATGWGPGVPRSFRPDAYWQAPLAWDRKARRQGRAQSVFCASMCDVFEGTAEQAPARERLWRLIEATPNLVWKLLTKRPNAIARLAPWSEWPRNVWTGCTIETQQWADQRLPHLLAVPSVLRFASVEPLLGALDLSLHLGHGPGKLNWVLCGGESGAGARGGPQTIDWYRSLRDQCSAAGVPFFFKQWGRFRQEGEDLVRLRGKNPDNRLDGARWEQHPALEHRSQSDGGDRADEADRGERGAQHV